MSDCVPPIRASEGRSAQPLQQQPDIDRMDEMLFADAFAEEIESYRHRPVAGTGTPESDALDVLKRYLQEPNPYVPYVPARFEGLHSSPTACCTHRLLQASSASNASARAGRMPAAPGAGPSSRLHLPAEVRITAGYRHLAAAISTDCADVHAPFRGARRVCHARNCRRQRT